MNTNGFIMASEVALSNKNIQAFQYGRIFRRDNITSHYSAPEIEELLAAANRVCEVNPRKSPALTILKRKTG